MTKTEARLKIKEMLPHVSAYVQQRCRELIDSGAVDLEAEASESYRLSKLILTAALQDAVEYCYSPFPWDVAGRKIVKNLRHF